ncbi:ogr/Delta-like zinc finger family protein [Pseudomonas citronellolis]|uniref:ogr/Delta-like zinc finger family protein n=1 Tax=Pseudomonas citronellolis TaxID=53408 RepID=UPI000E2E7BA3|nr:ogr/Delta-like zinc finger family protein [Pseudomonas citronellolis]
MRIHCPECGEKSRISSRRQISLQFTTLYCQCLDAENCGHRFVMQLTYSHTLTKGAGTVETLLFDRLCEMPKKDREELLRKVEATGTAT